MNGDLNESMDSVKLLSSDINYLQDSIEKFRQTSFAVECRGGKNVAVYYHRINHGGVQRVISLLIPMYVKMGYKVILVTDEEPADDDYPIPVGVRRYVIGKMTSADTQESVSARAAKLKSILLKEGIECFVSHAASDKFLIYYLMLVKKMGIRFVVVRHEFFSQALAVLDNNILDSRDVYSLADGLVVLSRAEQEFWSIYGINATYIHNPMEGNICRIKKHTDPPKIVWAGRYENQKQYMDAVHIMKIVASQCPRAELHMYLSERKPRIFGTLKKAIADNHLEKNIILEPYTTDSDVIYEGATVHLVTSAFESFSMVICESKSRGIPLVTYDMPYLELLKSHKGAVTVEQGDIAGAAQGILEILQDDKRQKELSEGAVESIKPFYSDNIEALWESVLLGTGEIKSDLPDISKDEYQMLIKTMVFHYSRGYGRYSKLAGEYGSIMADLKIKEILLRKYKEKKKIVLYPYGNIGRQIYKRLLEENEDVAFVIDNQLAYSQEYIKPLRELAGIDCRDFLFVVCSNNAEIYSDIRDSLREYVDDGNILDLYPNIEGCY